MTASASLACEESAFLRAMIVAEVGSSGACTLALVAKVAGSLLMLRMLDAVASSLAEAEAELFPTLASCSSAQRRFLHKRLE
jgi:hypothetical protein